MKTIACLSSAGFGKIAVVAFAAASLALGASAATKASDLPVLFSPGDACIDTGVDSGAAQYAVEIKYMFADGGKDKWIFGADNGKAAQSIAFGLGDNNKHTVILCPDGLSDLSVPQTDGVTSMWEAHTLKYNVDGRSTFDDLVFHEEYYPQASAMQGLNFYLFALNLKNAVYGASLQAYVFYCKIWKVTDTATHARELVRDFSPCLDTEGVAGMYDAVSGDIFYSKTSTPFWAPVLGNNLQYVQSDRGKRHWMQTGLTFSGKKYGVDMKYAIVNFGGDDWAFGVINGSKGSDLSHSLTFGMRSACSSSLLLVGPTETATHYHTLFLPTGAGQCVAQPIPADGEFHEVAYNIGGKTTFDGQVVYEGTLTYPEGLWTPMAFGVYSDNVYYPMDIRIASLKVTDEDGSPLRDFVAARDVQGHPGLFEQVGGWMYYPKPIGKSVASSGVTAGPVANACFVEVTSERAAVIPAQGRYDDPDISGDSLTLAAEEYAYMNGRMYQCVGYALSTSADGLNWSVPVTNAALSYVYRKGVASTRVTWLWQQIASRLTAFAGPGAVAFGTEPRGTDGDGVKYYTVGEGVSLEAQGEGFVRWYGPIGTAQPSAAALSLTMTEEPVELTAYFSSDWVYDPSSGRMSDGYWTQSVDVRDGQFVVGFVSVAPHMGVVDYRKPIIDGAGGEYHLTGIGDSAFAEQHELEEVYLPDTLETIGYRAFYNDDNIRSVEPFLPECVRSIRSDAFLYCRKLASPLSLGFGAADVDLNGGTDHFCWCQALSSVRLGPGVRKVSAGMFYRNEALTNVEYSACLGTIGRQAFEYCTALEAVDLPNSVTNIGNEAFCFDSSVKVLRVGFGKDVVTTCDGQDHFCQMTGLKKAEFGPAIPTMPRGWCFNTPLLGEFSSFATEFGPYCCCAPTGVSMPSLTNVTFRGERPPVYILDEKHSAGSFAPGFSDYQMKVFVPQGNAAWNAWITANVTPWNELGDLQTEYTSRYGETGKKPIGLTKDSAVPAKQWLFYEPSLGTMVLVR